jgi:hypothetical protein
MVGAGMNDTPIRKLYVRTLELVRIINGIAGDGPIPVEHVEAMNHCKLVMHFLVCYFMGCNIHFSCRNTYYHMCDSVEEDVNLGNSLMEILGIQDFKITDVFVFSSKTNTHFKTIVNGVEETVVMYPNVSWYQSHTSEVISSAPLTHAATAQFGQKDTFLLYVFFSRILNFYRMYQTSVQLGVPFETYLQQQTLVKVQLSGYDLL